MAKIRLTLLLLLASPLWATEPCDDAAESPKVTTRSSTTGIEEVPAQPVIRWEYVVVPGEVTVEQLLGEVYVVGESELERVSDFQTLGDGAEIFIGQDASFILRFDATRYAEFSAAPKERYVILRIEN